MSVFERLALVWTGQPEHTPVGAPAVGTCGLPLYGSGLPCDVLAWQGNATPDLSKYSTFIVTAFGIGERHISQIRAVRPNALIIAWPDPPPEHVFLPGLWGQRYELMLAELKLADGIAKRTPDGGEMTVFAALADLPLIYTPIIVLNDANRALRALPKEDYIFTTGHSWEPRYVAHQVAALTLIQRATGLRVVWIAETEQARALARIAGLQADFQGRVSVERFAELAARARLAVDPYHMHSVGRSELLCAGIGTPVIGSTTSIGGMALHVADAWRPDHIAQVALALLDNSDRYNEYRQAGMDLVERLYSDVAVRRALQEVVALGERKAAMPEHWWDRAALNTREALESFYQHPPLRPHVLSRPSRVSMIS